MCEGDGEGDTCALYRYTHVCMCAGLWVLLKKNENRDIFVEFVFCVSFVCECVYMCLQFQGKYTNMISFFFVFP